MYRTNKTMIYLILIPLFAIAILCVVVFGLRNTPAPKAAQTAIRPVTQVEIKEVERVVEVEKLVEVEKTITSGILQDGLNDMGVLITQEYYFTDVIGYSSVKKLLKTDIQLPFTESSYLASYDGVVTAGIDFSKIKVDKDDDDLLITVSLPKATIQNVDIDPNSFQLHSEKNGLCNPISPADFNQSLVELENSAGQKALERGLLEQADINARAVVQNFVRSLVDTSRYNLLFVTL